MNYPDNLKYSKDHEWIRVEGDEAFVGITAFAASELGDIVFVDVDTEGESLDQDEVFGSVEAVKTVSDLFLPVAGEVLEFFFLSHPVIFFLNYVAFGFNQRFCAHLSIGLQTR